MNTLFIIIDYDGFNVGLKSHFVETFLVFDSLEDALEIANHYANWIKGEL